MLDRLPVRETTLQNVLYQALRVAVVSAWLALCSVPAGAAVELHIREALAGGEYVEAENLARDALGGAQPDRDRADLLDLLVEARWRQDRAYDEETLGFALRAVELREAVVSLDNLAVVRALRGEFTEALELHERALGLVQRTEPPEPLLRIRVSLHLAATHWRKLDFHTARLAFEPGLAELESLVGPDAAALAKPLAQYCTVLFNSARYEPAKEVCTRSLEIAERVFGPDHPLVAEVLNRLGLLAIDIDGDPGLATEHYERALGIARARYGEDHPLVAGGIAGLATVARDAGRFGEARVLYERAIDILSRSRGPDHHSLCGPLERLAWTDVVTGDQLSAFEAYTRAIEIAEETFDEGNLMLAVLYGVYGNLLRQVGDLEGGRRALDRSIALHAGMPVPNDYMYGASLGNRGALSFALGEWAEAKDYWMRGKRRFEPLVPADHVFFPVSDLWLGKVEMMSGNQGAAVELLQRSLDAREAKVGPDHPWVAEVLESMTDLAMRQGDLERAEGLLRRALAIRLAADKGGQTVAANTLTLAVLDMAYGRDAKALEGALEAERIGREILRLGARTFSERRAMRLASIRSKGLDVAMTIALQGDSEPAAARRAWDAVVRSRSLLLDETAARHRTAAAAADPGTRELAADLARTRAQLANLAYDGSVADPLYAELTTRKESIEERLARTHDAVARELQNERIGLEQVLGSLERDDAVVAYVRFDRVVAGPRLGKKRPAYAAFVAVAGREPVAVDLGAAGEIDARAEDWRREAARRPAAVRSLAEEVEREYRVAGDVLRKRVWDPVVRHVNEASRVFVVPDGALHMVNLATLPVADGRYLIEHGPLLHHLSTERDLVRSVLPRREEAGILVVGGPDYDAPAGPPPSDPVTTAWLAAERGAGTAPRYRSAPPRCGGLRELRFASLPGASSEADEVARLWDKRSLTLKGARAHERLFKVLAPGHGALHLATHGFFAGAGCPPHRGGGELPIVGDDLALIEAQNPLLLAGLALAGANNRAQATLDQEDGILTAEEIASLDLSRARWAVLSGCETGTGASLAGQGLFGLQRAFRIAGVDSVIVSLWNVEDEATRRWMRALYATGVEKRSAAVAVRSASLELLKQSRDAGRTGHPFHWGAFVAAGQRE
jgi:CHAT domain-containing protein/tetratricopeptide (TPR) repeat protein